MKKINKALLVATPIIASLIPVITLGSCAKANYFEEITQEYRQIESDEDGYAIYHVTLKNKIADNQDIYIDIDRGNKSQDDVNVECHSKTYVEDKDVWFILYLSAPKDIKTYWQEFSVTFNCVYNWSGAKVWSQKVSGYKLTFNRIYDSHALSCESKISNIKTSLDKSEVGEEDEFTLKIDWDTNRKTNVSGAYVTITAGLKSLPISISGDITSAGRSLTFTKKQIQDWFTDAGIGTIWATDPINLTVVRKDAYEVKDNRLYQLDEFGESQLVADADIPRHSFLVINEDDELILHTESSEGKDDALKNFLASANKQSYDVILLKGEFFNYGQGTSSATKLNIYGIDNSKGEKISSLRAYWKDDEQGYVQDYGVGWTNVSLDLHNLYVTGRSGAMPSNWSDKTQGIMGPVGKSLTATNCDFTGAYCLWYASAVFNNCTFDSRNAWKEDGKGNVYPMWIQAGAEATFNECDFYSGGKALKIYCTGGNKIVVNECTFTLDLSSIITKTGNEPEVKSPIEIGTDCPLTSNLDVYYKSCVYTDFTTKGKNFINIDTGTHPNVIIHPEQLPE